MSRTAFSIKAAGSVSERLLARSVGTLLVMHVLAAFALFNASWEALIAFLSFHFVAGCLGGVVGFHRLLSHGSFRTHRVVRGVFALFGTLMFQGGPLFWSAIHRAHHEHNEERGDAHSAKRGFLWSHFVWSLFSSPNGYSHLRGFGRIKDLTTSNWLRFLDKYHLEVNVGTAVVIWGITRRLDIVLWAFPLRIVVFWHSTWLLNSYCHGAGIRAGGNTRLKNSWWVALLTYGEGWHANHHLRPDSSSLQFRWWQYDPGYYVIKGLQKMRIVGQTKKTRSGRRLGSEHRGRKAS